jgi:two-component system, response regulator YesN
MKFQNVADLVAEYVISRNMRELAQLTRYIIANELGINKNYLSERFKEETEMTVLQFINFEKMKRAEKLLRNRSDLSIRQISNIVGIVKLEQFRAKFKKIYAVNPGKYRAIIKN